MPVIASSGSTINSNHIWDVDISGAVMTTSWRNHETSWRTSWWRHHDVMTWSWRHDMSWWHRSVMTMSWQCHDRYPDHVMTSWWRHDILPWCHHDVLFVIMTSWNVIMTQYYMSSWRHHDVMTRQQAVFSHQEGKFIEITFNISKHMLSIDLLHTSFQALFAISLFLVRDKTALWFLAVRFCCRFCSASSTVPILGLGLGKFQIKWLTSKILLARFSLLLSWRHDILMTFS